MAKYKEINYIFKRSKTVKELINNLEKLPEVDKYKPLHIDTYQGRIVKWIDRFFNKTVRFRIKIEK